jgi:hypothetical protein
MLLFDNDISVTDVAYFFLNRMPLSVIHTFVRWGITPIFLSQTFPVSFYYKRNKKKICSWTSSYMYIFFTFGQASGKLYFLAFHGFSYRVLYPSEKARFGYLADFGLATIYSYILFCKTCSYKNLYRLNTIAKGAWLQCMYSF